MQLVFCRVLLGARQGQRTRGFKNAAGVLKHVFDRGTNRIGIHDDKVVDVFAHQTKGFYSDLFDGGAV